MRYLFTYIILCIALTSQAQQNDIRFKHLTVQDGLSRSWVRCFYQDSYGLLWVGTNDGLNRYDGYSFKVYRYRGLSEIGLNGNNVNLIYEDRQGRLWIGTQDGLNLYNRDMDYFTSLDVIGSSVDCIYELQNGNLLVGTPEGLLLLDGKSFTQKTIFSDIYVDAIIGASSDRLWLGTYSGLRLMDTNDFSYVSFNNEPGNSNSLSQDMIRSLLLDSQDRLWIGTNSGGLNMLTFQEGDINKPRFTRFLNQPRNEKSIRSGAILCLMEDQHARLWVGIENGGLNIFHLTSIGKRDPVFKHYQHFSSDEYSLSSNSVHAIYCDKEKTIWLGLYTSGIDYYNELHTRFSHYKQIAGNANSLTHNSVNAILNDGRYLYLGTEGGLNILDRSTNRFRAYVNDPEDPSSLGSDAVWAICKDRYGMFWIGTWGGGLNLFDPEKGTFTRFMHDPNDPNSLGCNSVYDVIEDSEGELWIACMGGGLNRYDRESGKFTRYMVDYHHNSISNNWVISLLESSKGEIWISTTTAVDMLNKTTGRFLTFRHNDQDPKSINYNRAVVIFEDSKEHIWIGTSAGLNLFWREDSSFRHYTMDQGLPDNTVKAICEDDEGNLWLSTNKGISKFMNGVDLPERPVFINYDVSDGLQGNEFNSRAACRADDGIIYFGGTRGMNAFHPDSVRPDTICPKVILTDFQVFNKPVGIGADDSPLVKQISLSDEIRLKHKQSVFTIEYAALNFLFPEKMKYAYKLDGFDNDWNYVGMQRAATYTNLDPGKYTFRVIASINDHFSYENPVSLRIVVLHPWWSSLPAKIAYMLLVVLALYFFRKYTLISVNLRNKLWLDSMQKEKDEELNKLKLQFFTNISHELRTPLTLIVGPLDRLLRKKKEVKELNLISRNVNRLRMLVDQILDFQKIEDDAMLIRLEQTEVISTIESLVNSFGDYAETRNVLLSFRSNRQSLSMPADQDKLDKILTNLLSNAIKYTPALGEVVVSVEVIEQDRQGEAWIQIEVSDTGRGIPEREIDRIFDRFYTSGGSQDNIIGSGIGLHLTRHLVEMHKGTIHVRSREGEGSVFTIRLPLMKEEILQTLPGSIERSITRKKVEVIRAEKESSERTKSHSIAVIDDNPDICDYLYSILSDEYEVFMETRSAEGLEFAMEEIPDLIISDVMMPEMDGFELCRRLKTDLRTCHIPVILLTAKTGREDQIVGLETGADDYICKPFDDILLLTRIRNLIQQRERLRELLIGKDLQVNPGVKLRNLDREFMDRVLEILQQHYTNSEFNVNHLIDTIGMSRSVFYKKFKALSSQSINDLLKEIRLKKAEEMLGDRSFSISEIAYRTGFSDPSYFSKVFREQYKLTPKEYQNR